MSPTTITQTFTQAFDRTYYNMFSPESVSMAATFASAPPNVPKVMVTQDQTVLTPGPFLFAKINATRYTSTLQFDPMLGPGTYEGDLTLQLCHDTSCGSVVPLTGNKVHYKLTVIAGLKVTLKVDGAEFTSPNTAVPGTSGTQMTVQTASSVHVDFTSTIPVTWSVAPDGSVPCDGTRATLTETLRSSTALSMNVQNNDASYACGLMVTAAPTSGQTQAQYVLDVAHH